MRKIKTGDVVIVTSGNAKGKQGKVLSVRGDRVIVEGLNKAKKFVRKGLLGKNADGAMVEIEKSIHISNVQLLEDNKAVRVGFKVVDGKKVRVAKKSGNPIVTVAVEVKEEKKPAVKKKVVKKKAKLVRKSDENA